jgi:hypothetical protein
MILTKISKQEQAANSRTIQQFEHAFITGDIDQLKELLHDQGLFLGRRTKSNAIALWNKQFYSSEGILLHHHVNVNRGFSRYGEEVLELRLNKSLNIDEEVLPHFRSFGQEANHAMDERVFRFTFAFLDGKISSVQQPKEYTSNVENFVSWN